MISSEIYQILIQILILYRLDTWYYAYTIFWQALMMSNK